MERGCELRDVLGELHAWQGGNLEQSRYPPCSSSSTSLCLSLWRLA